MIKLKINPICWRSRDCFRWNVDAFTVVLPLHHLKAEMMPTVVGAAVADTIHPIRTKPVLQV